jgi:hypothetical protein
MLNGLWNMNNRPLDKNVDDVESLTHKIDDYDRQKPTYEYDVNYFYMYRQI